MSNLTLPKMTYVTLNNLILNAYARNKRFNGTLKIAYETTIERSTDKSIVVRHHGNPIAHMFDDGHSAFITISGSGWNSQTTANRLSHILRDNQTIVQPGFDRLYYSVSSRDNKKEFGLFLIGWNHETKVRNIRDIQHGSAHFSRVSPEHHFVLHGE